MKNDASEISRARKPLSPWAGRAALVFVLLTLVTLVTVPVIVQRRVDRLRQQIEMSEPARTLVNQLQYHLVREMGALSELLLTGGAAPSGAYAAARAAEDTIYAELEPIVADMGREVVQRFSEARTLADQWHRRAATPETFEDIESGVPLMDIPRERALFEEVLKTTGALDRAIMAHTTRVREEIVTAENIGLRLTVGLGLLALVAAGVVAALEERGRRYANAAAERQRVAERALAETAHANEARTRLIRGITHDVKNPLGAAKGYAELLTMGVKGDLTPGQRKLVEGVERSIDSALAIIADLLDMARADSGGLTVNRVRARLADIAQMSVEAYRGAAEAAGHVLEVEIEVDVELYTDPSRARQVLDNLLSNAVKYTPSPGRIIVRTEESTGEVGSREGRWAMVNVIDNGPGIPEEMREAVFDEFTRIEDHGTMQGHGLGLAVARRVARLLGGELTVDGCEEGGARFVLWLPLRDEHELATG